MSNTAVIPLLNYTSVDNYIVSFQKLKGNHRARYSIDLFIFNRDFPFEELLEVVVGRHRVDNYLMVYAHKKPIPLVGVPVQPSRKGGRRFPVSLLLLDAVCYDEQLLLRDTHPQRAPCREKDESVLSLYIAIYRPNL